MARNGPRARGEEEDGAAGVLLRVALLDVPEEVAHVCLGEEADLREALDVLHHPVGHRHAAVDPIPDLEGVIGGPADVLEAGIEGDPRRQEDRVRRSDQEVEGAASRLERGVQPHVVVLTPHVVPSDGQLHPPVRRQAPVGSPQEPILGVGPQVGQAGDVT